MTEEQLVFRNTIPQQYRTSYDKAIDKKSKVAAIKVKCLDCMNWDKKLVKECDITTCPLWSIRPYNRVRAGQKSSEIDDFPD